MRNAGPVLLLLSIFLPACFGVDSRGGILRYERGRAFTGTISFEVGKLPAGWKGPRLSKKQMIFTNRSFGGTIVTDALCGPKFDDASLPVLARNLFYQFEEPQMKLPQLFLLDGREALRLRGSGKIDGVAIGMDAVVFKKNRCLYDFVYFAPAAKFPRGENDFEGYVDAVRAP